MSHISILSLYKVVSVKPNAVDLMSHISLLSLYRVVSVKPNVVDLMSHNSLLSLMLTSYKLRYYVPQQPASCPHYKPLQFIPRPIILLGDSFLILSPLLRLVVPSGLFPSGCLIKILHLSPSFPVSSTYSSTLSPISSCKK